MNWRAKGKVTLGDAFAEAFAQISQKASPVTAVPPVTAKKTAPVVVTKSRSVVGVHQRTRPVQQQHNNAAKPGGSAMQRTVPSQLVTKANKAPSPIAPARVAYKPTAAVLRAAVTTKVDRAVAGAFPTMVARRPTGITSESQNQVDSCLERGSALLRAGLLRDRDDGYIVGIDFGTSSVKLAVSQPYRSGDPVKAMVTPPCLRFVDDPQPHLWPATVWLEPTAGLFRLYPTMGAVALDGFKAGLITGHGNDRAHPDLNVARDEAAAAFLTLQIAHFFGYYQLQRPLGIVGAENFMNINIGVPVQSLDERKTVAAFRRVVNAAIKLGAEATHLSLTSVRQQLADASLHQLPDGFSLIPELTAAIAGYVAESTAPRGPHLLIDVGASTFDSVAFNLVKSTERVSAFASRVDMLGGSALEWALNGGVTADEFQQALENHYYSVISQACSDRGYPRGFSPQILCDGPVRLIVTGGGCRTKTHSEFLAKLPCPGKLGAGLTTWPLPPMGILSEGGDATRLLLAYGLARDVNELFEIRLPSQISRLEPLPVFSQYMAISKDQV